MGGVDGEGCRTPGAEGLCQERRGLQEARETGEGHRAAGRAGEESAGPTERMEGDEGDPGGRRPLGPALWRERREWKDGAPSYVPGSIDGAPVECRTLHWSSPFPDTLPGALRLQS